MWSEEIILMILKGIKETLYMTLASTILGYVFGLPLGICLAVSESGIKPNAVCYKILDMISNIVRSIPFLILLILHSVTRWIVGQSYGSSATIVPLVVAAVPFYCKNGRIIDQRSRCRCDRGGQINGSRKSYNY